MKPTAKAVSRDDRRTGSRRGAGGTPASSDLGPCPPRPWRGRSEWNRKTGWITSSTGEISGRTSSGRKKATAAYPLSKLRSKPEELVQAGKSADWKLAMAAALKVRTTVTNRWLAAAMHG